GGTLNMEAAIEIDTPIATTTTLKWTLMKQVDIIEGIGIRSLSSSKRGNLLGSM
ncbi:hypothetical protein HAX54_040269, partial [Datura stramonium]|nr:hypothetical protein [Datura stramonium]